MPETTVLHNGAIVTCKQAMERKLKRYFTGKLCPRGHAAQRLVSNRQCVLCCSQNAAETAPRRRKANQEYYRVKNRDAMRKWRAKHPEESRVARRRQRAKNVEVERERDREHYRKTKEYQKERHRAYRQSKPHIIAALAAKRRADIIRQTPSWADMLAIRLVYLEAERVTTFSGINHHVDHIIPLRGKSVCGLHWELNLRVITMQDNLEKSNKLLDEV